MQSPQEIIDREYLEARCALLEIAAVFDRYDTAVERLNKPAENTEKLECLRKAMELIAQPEPSQNRAEQLLHLYATV